MDIFTLKIQIAYWAAWGNCGRVRAEVAEAAIERLKSQIAAIEAKAKVAVKA